MITGLGEDAGTEMTATECGLGSGHSVPQRLQSKGAGKGLADAVVNVEHAEVAVATQPGVVAGPPDDGKRTRCPARRRRRRSGLGMEKNREGSAAIVTGERLPNRAGDGQLAPAATDE